MLLAFSRWLIKTKVGRRKAEVSKSEDGRWKMEDRSRNMGAMSQELGVDPEVSSLNSKPATRKT
ncbi:MAG: hypothetical protein WBH98_00800 [Bacteroidales bacterium]